MGAVDFALLNAWADRLRPVAEQAGVVTLEVRARGFAVATKDDRSPVTEADQLAEALVTAELERLQPTLPIVAEERVAAGGSTEFPGHNFWLVDALDGTKEFVKGGDDYTVNIALVWQGVPVLGIVHAPARFETYLGVTDPMGGGRRAEVWRKGGCEKIAARQRAERVVVVGSKSHEQPALMDPFLGRYQVGERIAVGSSLKFCLVAAGIADIYPRFGPTSEWDIGAGHAVLRAAGGRVHDFDGTEIGYKKPGFRNGAFLAEGQTGAP